MEEERGGEVKGGVRGPVGASGSPTADAHVTGRRSGSDARRVQNLWGRRRRVGRRHRCSSRSNQGVGRRHDGVQET